MEGNWLFRKMKANFLWISTHFLVKGNSIESNFQAGFNNNIRSRKVKHLILTCYKERCYYEILIKSVLQKERSKEYYLNDNNSSHSHFSSTMFYKRIHPSLYHCCYSIFRYVSSSKSIQSNSRAKFKMVSRFFYSFVLMMFTLNYDEKG